MIFQACFDESGTHDGSALVCVAGYLFDPDQFLHAEREVRELTRAFNIDYFRMTECAHGKGECRSLPLKDRIELERRVIGIIHRRAEVGMAACVNPLEFEMATTEDDRVRFGGAYSMCAFVCMSILGQFIRNRRTQSDYVHYFFEAGHAKQAELNRLMENITAPKQAPTRQKLRFLSHTFAQKLDTSGVGFDLATFQLADFLAWQYRKDMDRKRAGKLSRDDYAALIDSKAHLLADISKIGVASLVDYTRRYYDALRDGRELPEN